MPFGICCDSCNATLYVGRDLRPAREILKNLKGKCSKCGKPLSHYDFKVDVERLYA